MSSTLNIPGITKIEYLASSDISLPDYIDVQASMDIASYLSGTFTEIDFIRRSASLNQNLVHEDAGDAYEIDLPFNLAGNSAVIIALLKELRTADYVYRVTDANGQQYLLAHPSIKVRFDTKFTVKANPSGQRGYNCNLSMKTPEGLIYLT